jgi:zinc/manganese transport system substrate-binding protein
MQRTLLATAVAAASVLTIAGCSSTASTPSATGSAGGGITVVASTNAWGSIAQVIGGDGVNVTSILSDPSQDPHSFEGSAKVQLEISKAALVIDNGGGYDDWATTMFQASGSTAPVITAADVSGYDQNPSTGEFNEHLWYDMPTVVKVADKIATELATIDPSGAAGYQQRAQDFDTQIQAIEARETALKVTANGAGAAITEPVPLYMLESSGFTDVTPSAFSEAVEAGTDVSPAVLKQTLDLFSQGTAKVLVYNSQTSGAETDAVVKAAQSANVPVVPVTETMPDGDTFVGWMTANLDAIEKAIS